MGVDHRRAHVFVSHQLLHRPNVAALLEQVSGKGMAEYVTGNLRVNSSQLTSRAYRALQCVLKDVVSSPHFGFVVPNEFCCAEDAGGATGVASKHLTFQL